ncbi:MAG: hypothetical protein ABI472_03355 [Ginsengibacter sp.]
MKKLQAFFSGFFKKQKSFSSLYSEAISEGIQDALKNGIEKES